MAYAGEKGIDDYDMAYILADTNLIELYKQSHQYLDDMVYFPAENAKMVQEIGYSRIWQVMEVRAVSESGGEHVTKPHQYFFAEITVHVIDHGI